MTDPAGGDRPAGDVVVVRGGAGGTRARLEELDRVVALLAAAAQALAGAAWRTRRVVDVLRAGPAPGAAEALAPLTGPALPAAADRAEALADAVAGVAGIYREADADASAGVRRVVVAAGYAWGEAGPIAWLAGAAAAVRATGTLVWLRAERFRPGPVGAMVLALAAGAGRDDAWGAVGRLFVGPGLLPPMPTVGRGSAEAGVAGASAFLLAALPGRAKVSADPVPRAARLLATGLDVLDGPTTLRVTPALRPVSGRPPRDEADVLGLVADQYDGEGQVGVQRLDHADGSRTWVVAVPGTQAGLGANPFDARSDLELVAGVEDDVTALVVRAMDAAGVAPGEPVLLAGHSEGGIAATRLAADPLVGTRFEIAAVLTAGAPVAGIALPVTTAALHLEHADDVVPGLRGLPNPDTPTRTTVVRDLSTSTLAAERAATQPAGTHQLTSYQRTATLLPAEHPSIAGFRRATATVLGPDVVQATTYTFTGERVADVRSGRPGR